MKIKLLLLFMCVQFCMGCARDNVSRIKDVDFSTHGGITGKLAAEGDGKRGWLLSGVKFVNQASQTAYPIRWGWDFFKELPPGDYKMHVRSLTKDGYNSTLTVALNTQSDVFSVDTGEVVYLGDMAFGFTLLSGPDLKKLKTWVGFLAGKSSSNVRSYFTSTDEIERFRDQLSAERPEGDFRVTKHLIRFGIEQNTSMETKADAI